MIDSIKTGKQIRKCRRQLLDITQRELAEAVGTSTVSISKWERGAVLPSLEMALALSKVFGIPINAIIVEKEAEA